jgi:hypothetical protein
MPPVIPLPLAPAGATVVGVWWWTCRNGRHRRLSEYLGMAGRRTRDPGGPVYVLRVAAHFDPKHGGPADGYAPASEHGSGNMRNGLTGSGTATPPRPAAAPSLSARPAGIRAACRADPVGTTLKRIGVWATLTTGFS